MNKIYLITTVELKENSIIEFNVDDNKLIPVIWKSQEMFLQPILGKQCYLELLNAFDTDTLSPEQDELLYHCKLFLFDCATYNSLTTLRSKLTNKSISHENSLNSQVAQRDDLKDLKNEFYNNFKYFEKEIVKFLNNNKDFFPCYISSCDCSVKNDRLKFGIYLPKKL
jgi:hypothetical protein